MGVAGDTEALRVLIGDLEALASGFRALPTSYLKNLRYNSPTLVALWVRIALRMGAILGKEGPMSNTASPDQLSLDSKLGEIRTLVIDCSLAEVWEAIKSTSEKREEEE
jgi:hypothetical protein